ncbi:MAG TPA: GNAT family N-acetyltransferase [Anaerolineae bacterium]|nr:GNAT family N-acetyltransferase [Anaerolineae bacterium]
MGTRDWRAKYRDRLTTPSEALRLVRRGCSVFIGSGAAVPRLLITELSAMAANLANVRLIHGLTLALTPTLEPEFGELFRHDALFIGPEVRDAVCQGRADYTPVFLSEVPKLFSSQSMHLDVALIQVTPPDQKGLCSYGVSVDVVKAAAENARHVIAEVNPRMPRTLGDSFIHVDRISAMVENDSPLPEVDSPPPDEVSLKIARNVASLVQDGDTIQLGISKIARSVATFLENKTDLGVHTELVSDWILDLMTKGVVTNRGKTLDRGKVVTSFCLGTQRLYSFVDNNSDFRFCPCDYTNDPFVISQQENMVAINSALEIDLTGQVCSDSLGQVFYSGLGGQVDFMRGAAKAKGGKPIIALPSTAAGGVMSRIVSALSTGAGVMITRGDVHYVVTEYGIAYLHGKNVRERVLALISIAHPKFRAQLLEEAKDNQYIYGDQLIPVGIYPSELETTVTFRGEQVFFRPIKATDESMMQDFFYSLSDRSVYQRYFMMLRALPHQTVQAMTTIDYEREMAIVGVVRREGRERIVAVGRYGLIGDSSRLAEIAFTVRDDWQNIGIGSFLLNYLADIAARRGIEAFTAEILQSNGPMLAILNKARRPVKCVYEDGVYIATMGLDDHG